MTSVADDWRTPQWYKDAIIYELRVRSFFDSNGDGIGDFRGLEQKLDYIRSLGVNTIWLLPFYPSPLRDDGYDISDYTNVHPDCGTLADLKSLIRKAHRLGLFIITELVLNHSSDQHRWFQRARRASPGSTERDFYVWSDDPRKYGDARIIFSDFERSNWTWDPEANAYFWHRFYSHQPDLNFDSPAVQREIFRLVNFWLNLGVDGLRLDAVPYLYEREGTNCENLEETHAFLRSLRGHIDRRYPNRMLLAEANQWPEDAVAYLGNGDECHMAFHFPIMPRLFMALRMEDRFPLTDMWSQTPNIHSSCQWALFLRNHDELTLEMVTEEERDYMYQAYARETRMRINSGIRRRLAPLLGNNRRSIELINGLLLSLPGTPVLYYGDELGMGDNVYLGDRDGVRTPMQWSGDRNAGFSNSNPQQLILPVIIDYQYHYQTVNVEAQERNPHSLLWWMRRLIALRRQFKAFGRGSIDLLTPSNTRIIAFIRHHESETLLIVANLSRFVQYFELDLASHEGLVPVELFSRTAFPPITLSAYPLTLGPHGFIWFSLEPQDRAATHRLSEFIVSTIHLSSPTETFENEHFRRSLCAILPRYLPTCRWYRSKTRTIRSVAIEHSITLTDTIEIMLINVEYTSGSAETYVLPLGILLGEKAEEIRTRSPHSVVANLTAEESSENTGGILFDAVMSPEFAFTMLDLFQRERRLKSGGNQLLAMQTRAFHSTATDKREFLEPRVLKAEQSNTSIVFGNRLILKLFRKLEEGLNPDIEVGHFLTDHVHFSHTPPLAGWIDCKTGSSPARNFAVIQGFVESQADCWQFTLAELERYFEGAATQFESHPLGEEVFATEDRTAPDAYVAERMDVYLRSAHLMGERVAALHLAFLTDDYGEDFTPEPLSSMYQRSRYQSMRNLLGRTMRSLGNWLNIRPEDERTLGRELINHRDRLESIFDAFRRRTFDIVRTRVHGDLHLGQILFTGRDFVIIDFEGEPGRDLTERRRKRSPLADVAGMLRSFDYAALSVLTNQLKLGRLGNATFFALEPWARLWQSWAAWSFLQGYLEASGKAPYLPENATDRKILLDAFVLEKAIYELGYELDNRPDWVAIPTYGIARIIGIPPT